MSIHLVGEPGLLELVRDLTDREAACCSFLSFLIEGTDGDLVLVVTAPPERSALLDALADRAHELAERT